MTMRYAHLSPDARKVAVEFPEKKTLVKSWRTETAIGKIILPPSSIRAEVAQLVRAAVSQDWLYIFP